MPAVNRYYSSVAVDTTLKFSITSSDTSLEVNSTAGFPTSYPYTLALGFDLSNEELVTIIGASGNILTVGTSVAGGANVSGRGVDGTNDQAHAAAEPVKHVISARDMTEAQAHIAAEAGAHGITGNFVGTTDTQTLTNKTVTGGTVNPTTLQQGGVPAVTTTGTQELTNKTLGDTNNIKAGSTLTNNGTISGGTLSSPTISNPTITGSITGAVITSANIVNDTIVNADINTAANIDWTKLAISSTVSSTEIGYVDGVTSSIQTQLDAKAPTANPTFTGTVSGVSAAMVGLGNVNNTSDANKPVSTATQTALNLKLNESGGTVTGILNVASEGDLRVAGDVVRASVGGVGTSTVGSGGLFGVTHGLGTTPTAVVACQRANTYNSTPRIFSVGNFTSSSFTLFANDVNGTRQDTAFSWIAIA